MSSLSQNWPKKLLNSSCCSGQNSCWCLQVGQCLPHPAAKEEELQAECNKNLYEQAMLAMQRAQFYDGAERRAFLQASLLPVAS